MQKVIYCLSLLILVLPQLTAQVDSTVIILDTLGGKIDPDPYLEVFIDSAGQYSPEAIRSQEIHWTPYEGTSPDVSPHAHLWAKLKIKNSLDIASQWVIIDWDRSGYFDGYFSTPDSGFVHLHTGVYVPKKDRPLPKYHYVALPISFQPQEEKTLYVRVREIDHDKPVFALQLRHMSDWNRLSEEQPLVIIFSFISMMVIMFFYSLMVYIGNRESTYLFYALYILSTATFFLFAPGPHYLQFAPKTGMYIMVSSLSGISIFYFLFGRKFLNNSSLLPRWDKWIIRYIWLRVLILCLQLGIMAWNFNINQVIYIEFTFFLVDALVSVLWFIPLIRSKTRIVWFFISGSSLVFVFALSYLAISFLVLGGDTDFIWFAIAVILEILIFSLGLGYRIRQTEREKRAAQKEKLKAQEALNEELSKINSAFGRFVPHEFIKSLGHKSILDVKLGDGVEKEVSVLFSDIRGYTTLSENMSPKENFIFLNAYLGRMGPIIQQNHGFVNQYYGDGIMALFLQSPKDALKAAIQMFKTLAVYNKDRKDKGRTPIKIGIGLHTGPLMMGVMGDTLRLEAGVVSDTVNTASRMEGLTKYYHAQIILSEQMVQQIADPEEFALRFLGKVMVKGKVGSMKIFECYKGEPSSIQARKHRTAPIFSEALEHYFEKNFVQAAKLFDEVLKGFPDDPVTRRYKEYCAHYLVEGVPDSWTGVETMLVK